MAEKEYQEIKQELKVVSADIRRVLTYLDNDNMTGRKGLFQQVAETINELKKISDEFEAYKEEQETKLQIKKAVLASYGLTTGLAGYFLGFLIKIFFVWIAKVL